MFLCVIDKIARLLERHKNGNSREKYDHKVRRIRDVKSLRRVRKNRWCGGLLSSFYGSVMLFYAG